MILSVLLFFIGITLFTIILYSIFNPKPKYVRSKEKHHYPIPIPPDAPPSAFECGIVKVIKPDVVKCFDQLCPFYDPVTKQWAPVSGAPGAQCSSGGASKYATCSFGESCPGPQKPVDPPSRRQCNHRPVDVDQCFIDGGEFGNCCSSYDPVTKDWSDPKCHNNCNATAKVPLTEWKWKDPNCDEEDRSLCKDVSASYYYDCKNAFTQCKSNKNVTPSDCIANQSAISGCFTGAKCDDYNENTKKWMTKVNEDLCGVEGLNAQYYDKCSYASMCPKPATTDECTAFNGPPPDPPNLIEIKSTQNTIIINGITYKIKPGAYTIKEMVDELNSLHTYETVDDIQKLKPLPFGLVFDYVGNKITIERAIPSIPITITASPASLGLGLSTDTLVGNLLTGGSDVTFTSSMDIIGKTCFLNAQFPFSDLPLTPCASFDQLNKTWKAHNAFIGPRCIEGNLSRYQNCTLDVEPPDPLAQNNFGVNCPANAPTTSQFTDSICPALYTFLAKATDPTADPVDQKKATDLSRLMNGCLSTTAPGNGIFKEGGCKQFYNEIEKKWIGDPLCENLCNRIIDGGGVDVSFYDKCPFPPTPP